MTIRINIREDEFYTVSCCKNLAKGSYISDRRLFLPESMSA